MNPSRQRSPRLRVNELEQRCLTAAVSPPPAMISPRAAQTAQLSGRLSGRYQFGMNGISLQGVAQIDGMGAMRLTGQLDFGDQGPTRGWITLSNPRGSIVLLIENLTPIDQGEGGIAGDFKIVMATGGYTGMRASGHIWLAGEGRNDSGGVFVGQLSTSHPA